VVRLLLRLLLLLLLVPCWRCWRCWRCGWRWQRRAVNVGA
jgi:hypothetical protein